MSKGYECIACGKKKPGNTEPGMICAFCYYIMQITTIKEAKEYRMNRKREEEDKKKEDE